MDKRARAKDEIILRQLEVIRSMTEHNLSRMGTDFWGAPAPEKKEPAPPEKPDQSPRAGGKARRLRRRDGKGPGDGRGEAGDCRPGPPEGEDRGSAEGAGELCGPHRGEAGGAGPHQPGHGGAAAPEARPAHSGHEPPHGVHRQSRHRQDHHRPADGPDLSQPGHPFQGAAGGGGPQRPGGGLCGPDRHQDPEGHRLRPGGRAVHRRGLCPERRRGQRLRPGGHRHPAEGHGGPPGRLWW